ncbi:hypothetical protein ZIOFF_043107 [Zingiber officinale]|uniref:Uncharacterized protein n=1 Tax=Zingiber officinale TaxID=94328 RepID=A0A8J5G2W1_ZINOF|nr:hypothetical protein ZIOFF_043107 [Zingiber officinale]
MLNKKKRPKTKKRPKPKKRSKPSPPKPSPQPLRNSSASLHYRRRRCRRTPLYLSALTATSRRNPLRLSALIIAGRTTPPRLSALAVAARLPSISPYHRTTARVSKPFDSHSTLYIKPKAQSKGRIQWLAHGPREHVTSYTGYIVNGYRFHTIDVGRSTQDSGVSIEADTIYQSNTNDNSHTENITNKLSRMDSNNSANSSEDLHGKEPIADEKIDKKKG